MCTVTYIPTSDGGFLFGHSRDEMPHRASSIFGGSESGLIYPIDATGGGSWIVASRKGTAALLNGSREPHARNPPYRRSRGLLLLDFAKSSNPLEFTQKYDLSGIEPFTIISRSQDEMIEFHWNGTLVDIVSRDIEVPAIWASWTLYSEYWQGRRRQWFQDWEDRVISPTAGDLVEFHLHAGDGDPMHDVRVNRASGISTISITTTHHAKESCKVSVHSAIDGEERMSELL